MSYNFHVTPACDYKFHTLLHPHYIFNSSWKIYGESFHPCGHARKSRIQPAYSFPWLTSETKRRKLGLTLHPPPLNKTRNPLPFHLTYLAPSPPCHLTTLPPFSLSHLKSLPPTNKALQNNKIKPTVSPHIFLQKVYNITILKQGHIPPPGKRSQIVVFDAWFAGH